LSGTRGKPRRISASSRSQNRPVGVRVGRLRWHHARHAIRRRARGRRRPHHPAGDCQRAYLGRRARHGDIRRSCCSFRAEPGVAALNLWGRRASRMPQKPRALERHRVSLDAPRDVTPRGAERPPRAAPQATRRRPLDETSEPRTQLTSERNKGWPSSPQPTRPGHTSRGRDSHRQLGPRDGSVWGRGRQRGFGQYPRPLA
jgi:hypothetical protein